MLNLSESGTAGLQGDFDSSLQNHTRSLLRFFERLTHLLVIHTLNKVENSLQ
jgi:hypothetical protein